ncbi:MAG TPA: CRISPR-associated endonuclease Cas3'', partial [Methanocorpusculum sp.]|nr:CRISPR-associated endonuclease Cas3'' [Methanocorpusculum sp.]
MYLARRESETERTQTLAEHSRTVAQLCRKYGGEIDCPSLAELCGYLHDMGKAKQEFQTYLLQNDSSLRGKINHSSAGAQYIIERYGDSTNIYQKTAAQIIALVILSHHSGLIDCLSVDGEDIFSKRIHPEKDTHYEESRDNFLREILSENKIDELFSEAVHEIKNIIDRYKGQIELRFHLGLITRHLLSCVIDADRYD